MVILVPRCQAITAKGTQCLFTGAFVTREGLRVCGHHDSWVRPGTRLDLDPPYWDHP